MLFQNVFYKNVFKKTNIWEHLDETLGSCTDVSLRTEKTFKSTVIQLLRNAHTSQGSKLNKFGLIVHFVIQVKVTNSKMPNMEI